MHRFRRPRLVASLATLTVAALLPLTVAPASAAPGTSAAPAAPGAVTAVGSAAAVGSLPTASSRSVRWVLVDRATVTASRSAGRVVARPDDGTRLVVLQRTSGHLKVKVGGKTGWILRSSATPTPLKDVSGTRYTRSAVRVTKATSTSSRTVARVALGGKVKILARTTGRADNSVKVRTSSGKTGWVRASKLTQRNVWGELARCESGNRPTINTGNGYYGMYQFSARTWRSVGGRSLPHRHSAAEQTKRAQILQDRAGWGQWPACTRKLGLR